MVEVIGSSRRANDRRFWEGGALVDIGEWHQRIEQLVRSKGGTVSGTEFQTQLNVVFHDVEGKYYDRLHLHMWESLPAVFDKLLENVRGGDLVDIGCGTGLASTLVSQRLPIGEMWFVDTSSTMLDQCRARGWRSAHYVTNIKEVPDATADIVVTCSVLHHIPDLNGFCRDVDRILRAGGYFIHAQDGNPGAQPRKYARPRMWTRLARGAKTLFAPRKLPVPDYIGEVNNRLMELGLITIPLLAEEIWSITDLRVGGQPYSAASGVGLDDLSLPGYALARHVTYAFFGRLSSELSTVQGQEERSLMAAGDMSGALHAAVWRKPG
jgi:ubiquinone/menaquinone biosynthesis C-methylase UbiE